MYSKLFKNKSQTIIGIFIEKLFHEEPDFYVGDPLYFPNSWLCIHCVCFGQDTGFETFSRTYESYHMYHVLILYRYRGTLFFDWLTMHVQYSTWNLTKTMTERVFGTCMQYKDVAWIMGVTITNLGFGDFTPSFWLSRTIGFVQSKACHLLAHYNAISFGKVR